MDEKNNIDQKPKPRYGHASVYIEKMDYSIKEKPILRKYMYVYGGFSIYCDMACNDLWTYEISYAPQRYYPDDNKSEWNRGNKWSQLYVSRTKSPGPRSFHSMVTDENYEYIYLFGGMSYDANRKITIHNDFWRYEISTNIWERINVLSIASINRKVK